MSDQSQMLHTGSPKPSDDAVLRPFLVRSEAVAPPKPASKPWRLPGGKYGLDLLLGIPLALLLLPLLFVVACLARITTRRPALSWQRRAETGDKPLPIVKFRG